MFSSVTKSAKFTETCLELLASFDETVSSEDLGQLYTVLVAHINFLQLEYAGLVIKGQFDPETVTVFKCLQKNTTCFKGDSLDSLKKLRQRLLQQGVELSLSERKKTIINPDPGSCPKDTG